MDNDNFDLILRELKGINHRLDTIESEIKDIKSEQDRKIDLVIKTIKEYGKQNEQGLSWVVDCLTSKTKERFDQQKSVNKLLNNRLLEQESCTDQIQRNLSKLQINFDKILKTAD